MLMYGQEAGRRTRLRVYGFSGITNNNRNWTRYESNFGKSIPNFKRWNSMSNVWTNRDWTAQDLYGRINRARLSQPGAAWKRRVFPLPHRRPGMDNNIFAVAKFQQAGTPASSQNVVFCFVPTPTTPLPLTEPPPSISPPACPAVRTGSASSRQDLQHRGPGLGPSPTNYACGPAQARPPTQLLTEWPDRAAERQSVPGPAGAVPQAD
jgi:hypothetical protein